jgi:hypothetical protein
MRQARMPTDDFEKLLKESCPNHAYAIKHNLQDYSLMMSFMATGSLPQGTEVIEAPIEDDMVPFPGEDAVMTVFGWSSSPEKHRVLDPSKGTPTRGDQRWGDEEMHSRITSDVDQLDTAMRHKRKQD